MSGQPPGSRLVADIGGTNTRIAFYDAAGDAYLGLREFRNHEHAKLEDILALWLDAWDGEQPALACLAVAAPPAGDSVRMINIDWRFSRSEIAARFGFRSCVFLNDFEANAYALPHLTAADREVLHAGEPGYPVLATMGPGTGLGGSVLDLTGPTPRSRACEPGHMDLAPANALELELFRVLLDRHDRIYAELLVSGAGLTRIHEALAEVEGAGTDTLSPAEITAAVDEDELCGRTVTLFCNFLGAACGSFVVSSGAYGGLYVAGGIVPRILPQLKASDFLWRLQHKGVMFETLQPVPVYTINASCQPGLVGAAHAPT